MSIFTIFNLTVITPFWGGMLCPSAHHISLKFDIYNSKTIRRNQILRHFGVGIFGLYKNDKSSGRVRKGLIVLIN